jgi:hypothetical protein
VRATPMGPGHPKGGWGWSRATLTGPMERETGSGQRNLGVGESEWRQVVDQMVEGEIIMSLLIYIFYAIFLQTPKSG